MKFEQLSQVAEYVSNRVDVEKLSLDNYISTENMIPDRGGVTRSSKLPAVKTVSSFSKNDILISNIRPYFKKIWYANKNGGCSNDVLVIRAKEGIDSKFLYYVLSTDTFFNYTVASSKGTKMPRGDKHAIMQYKVPSFSIDRQLEIASILSALDDKIELNRRMNATLEEMAQAIFKEWFVDFNFPGATGEFVDSALGPIPIGWEAKPLDKVAHFLNGLALQKYPPKNEADELPVIKIKQLRANSIDGADISSKSISKEYHVSFADLLFSWSGSLEVSFWTGPNGALNQHLFKVTSKEYPLWFCYHWLLHYLPAFRSIAEGKATTMGHIKRENLSNKYCAIPPNIEKLGKHIEAIHRKILANSKEANYLEKTKETLLGYFFELRNNDGL